MFRRLFPTALAAFVAAGALAASPASADDLRSPDARDAGAPAAQVSSIRDAVDTVAANPVSQIRDAADAVPSVNVDRRSPDASTPVVFTHSPAFNPAPSPIDDPHSDDPQPLTGVALYLAIAVMMALLVGGSVAGRRYYRLGTPRLDS